MNVSLKYFSLFCFTRLSGKFAYPEWIRSTLLWIIGSLLYKEIFPLNLYKVGRALKAEPVLILVLIFSD